MKKLILLMLVAMVPLLTVAQKRTKKGKSTKTEKTDKSFDSKSNFMIIKGVEALLMVNETDQVHQEGDDVATEKLRNRHLKPESHFSFNFDYGVPYSKEEDQLRIASMNLQSMAEAVHHASKYGWEFINSTIVVDKTITIHYYYMKR